MKRKNIFQSDFSKCISHTQEWHTDLNWQVASVPEGDVTSPQSDKAHMGSDLTPVCSCLLLLLADAACKPPLGSGTFCCGIFIQVKQYTHRDLFFFFWCDGHNRRRCPDLRGYNDRLGSTTCSGNRSLMTFS